MKHKYPTLREMEVIQLIAKGYSDKEIGGILGVSVHTAHAHRRSIYKKLNVNRVAEMIFEAKQLGILD